MFRIKIAFLIPFFTLLTQLCIAQPETKVYTEANLAYKKGMEYYEKGLFAQARKEFERAYTQVKPMNEPEYRLLGSQAGLYYAKSAVRIGLADGEKLVLDFIRDYSPDPVANQAMLEMGNYYFNQQDYDKANSFYTMLDPGDLTSGQRQELKFKEGYGYFVKKQFPKAKVSFKQIKDVQGEFYNSANYYYGMTAFFEANYDEAIKSFQRVATSDQYKNFVPYYICQIFFAQNEFDRLISYGKEALTKGSTRNVREINQLIGQAYFEKQDYTNAVKFLESAADGASGLRDEDYYQLGYAQYKTSAFKKAIANFEQLNKANNKLGQSAMYSLGDCYIKNGQKSQARNAFAAASKMTFDSTMQDDALFNYAKLSYELKYDREAINALQQIDAQSKYYSQSQELLSQVFLNTRDFEQALSILENLPNKTPKIKETYQKVSYYRGVQLMKDGDPNSAKRFFNKSLENPVDPAFKAQATYWLGEIAYVNNEYDESIKQMGKFLTMEKTLRNLPDETSEYTANYTQGYNYIKQKNYNSALGYFQESVAGIKRDASSIGSDYIKNQVLADATLRTGDCLFKRNRYDDALKFYDEAITRKYPNYVYAYYQKAIIKGLTGGTVDKIIALEKIVKDYPNSEFTDDALLQLGITYQEINQLDKSVQPLKKLVNDFKGKSELVNQALLRLGLISYNQGNQQAAINYYKQVFSNNPESGEAKDAMQSLEEIYVEDLGKPDEYFAFLETIPGYDVDALAKDSINFKAAEAQFENGNYDRAIDGYSTYISKFPNGANNVAAHFNRGESYSVKQNYTEALKDYEFVAAKGSGKYYLKALSKAALICYNYSKDFQKSYDYFVSVEKAATTDDMRFDAQLGAMRSAYRINKTDAVFDYADKVANNSKANKEQLAVANFYLGKIAFDRKDYDKALASFNQVSRLSDNEQTAEARYLIAYIYYLNRDLDTALKMCENLTKQSSDYRYWMAKSVILQADIYAEKGDLFNAKAALEAVIDNFNEDQEILATAKLKLKQLEAKENNGAKPGAKPQSLNNDLEMDNGN